MRIPAQVERCVMSLVFNVDDEGRMKVVGKGNKVGTLNSLFYQRKA